MKNRICPVCASLLVICYGLAAGMLTAATAQAAEWSKVGGTHKFDRYVDMTTVGSTDQQATLWTLRDYHVERAIPRGAYRSVRIKRQYDCHEKKSRPLHVRYYQQPMGQGRVLYAAQATRAWSRVIPGSDDEREMKVACRAVKSTLGRR